MMADSGMKYDKGKIDKILALIVDCTDEELGLLINRLREEQAVRNIKKNKPKNTDTIHG